MCKAPLKLITLRAVAPQFDPAKGEAGLPPRILVLAWGEHQTTKGLVVCNETTIKELPAFNAAENWDRPCLDFEHNSVKGSPTYTGEPVKVAGYGTLQLVAGEGIYLVMTSWTPEGREYAAGGHYGDLSPVVHVNDRNEVIGLHSVALCRHGATPGLVFLSAMPGVHSPAADPSATSSKHATSMTPEQLAAALAKLLGLAETATPDEILNALTAKLKESETALSEAKQAAEGKGLSAADVAALKELSAGLKEQGATLKLLTTQVEAGQRGDIMAQAAREGKVVPKMAANMSVDQLKLLCAELPVTVPLEQRTVTGVLLTTTAPAATPELLAIDRLTGVSDDDVKKYGK